MTPDLGLALSGGGSRAAAFHRGTLRATIDLDLVRRVKSISSVSGGSVFAAAWMAARTRGTPDDAFLDDLGRILERGFISPGIRSWRILKLLIPGWTRTHLLAETFDRLLFKSVSLATLPEVPILCLNTTLVNNASAGRFSRAGYSGKDVSEIVNDSYVDHPVDGLSLGHATVASAAFPFGLPPLTLEAKRFRTTLKGDLVGARKLVFTDGGILENLGVERLLESSQFGATHILSSDAGLHDRGWRPSALGRIKGALIFALASGLLDRLLAVMNDKQNKSMRQILWDKLVEPPAAAKRCALFVRVDQDWDHVIARIPPWRLAELGISITAPREPALASVGISLDRARDLYAKMGAKNGFDVANRVGTNFTGLSRQQLDTLSLHAQWQVHMLHAIFGNKLATA